MVMKVTILIRQIRQLKLSARLWHAIRRSLEGPGV